jgi:hypothetical protein
VNISTKTTRDDGTVDDGLIADKNAEYFKYNCMPLNAARDEIPKCECNQHRLSYIGFSLITSQVFEVDLLN